MTALAVEELIIWPEVKLNLRPRKCHRPNSKPLLLHHILAWIPSSKTCGSVPLLLCNPKHTASCLRGKQTRRSSNTSIFQQQHQHLWGGAAVPVPFRKSRQLVHSPSTGTSHSHPSWANGSSAVWRGKVAGAEPGGDRTRALFPRVSSRRCAAPASQASTKCERTSSPTGAAGRRLTLLPPSANQPRAPRWPGCCRHRKARRELWLKRAFLGSRLSSVLVSAEGYFLQ